MRVIRKYRRTGALPHLVMISLGADYSITSSDIRRALRIIGKKRVLALMTPRELGGGSGSDADAVRRAYRKHTQRIMLLDWVRFSKGRGSWFQPDGLHLTFPGARAFAKLSHKSLKFAMAGDFPNHNRYPR